MPSSIVILPNKYSCAKPPGFVDPDHPDHVCLLSKALYGLKQSSRAWFTKLSSVLITLGFVASNYDPSLFLSHSRGHTTLILIYVDDILITGSDTYHVHQCIQHLQQAFSLKDLGPLHYFLGIEVQNTKLGLHLSQTKYLQDLLTRANMHTAKPCPTPMTIDSFQQPTSLSKYCRCSPIRPHYSTGSLLRR